MLEGEWNSSKCLSIDNNDDYYAKMSWNSTASSLYWWFIYEYCC